MGKSDDIAAMPANRDEEVKNMPTETPETSFYVGNQEGIGHVFISYSHVDTPTVTNIRNLLSNAGIPIWIDEVGISAGEQWRATIVDAIRSAKVFIIVLSEASIKSENVRKEVDIAEGAKVQLLPLLIDNTEIPSALEYQLAGMQRLTKPTNEQLLQAVAKYFQETPMETSLDSDDLGSISYPDKIYTRNKLIGAAFWGFSFGLIWVLIFMEYFHLANYYY